MITIPLWTFIVLVVASIPTLFIAVKLIVVAIQYLLETKDGEDHGY